MRVVVTAALVMLLPAATLARTPEAAAEVDRLARAYVAARLEADPTLTYWTGLPVPDHARLPDRTPEAVAAEVRRVDAIRADLDRVEPAGLDARSATLYAVLRAEVDGWRGLRVCKPELWSLSHFGGWQSGLPRVAEKQPVGTPEARAQALARWRGLPRFIDGEIANLRRGMAAGYTVPRPVAERVLKQVEGLLKADPEQSPFYSPARRDQDPAFQAAFATLVTGQIDPAVRRFRDFLRKEYLPAARTTLGLSALPEGEACWRALYRDYTTLERSPQEVFALGKQAVERNKAEALALARKVYRTGDLAEVVKRIERPEGERFATEAAALTFTRAAVARSRAQVAPFFAKLPAQPLVAEPYPDHVRGTGMAASYEREPDPTRPATYRVDLDRWREDTFAAAEIVAVHEGWPGHHLQIATANGLPGHDLYKLASNSAFTEGWARYAEALAEEAGVYRSRAAPIRRRLWPARGMMVDPGIHMLGWTREQAVAFLVESGRTPQAANDMVDRVAALPAQLTAYDSGGLEIFALRDKARRALGPRFDMRGFHQAVLGAGVVPLTTLRANVEAWVAGVKAGR